MTSDSQESYVRYEAVTKQSSKHSDPWVQISESHYNTWINDTEILAVRKVTYSGFADRKDRFDAITKLTRPVFDNFTALFDKFSKEEVLEVLKHEIKRLEGWK